MAETIARNGPPVTVTLATTCTLITTARPREIVIASDQGGTDVVRVVYSDSLADGGALPAGGYEEILCSQLPVALPVDADRILIQGSSAFDVTVRIR